jgi:hypothetical protein
MDIDLLGKIENSLEVIATAMKEACELAVMDDGLNFDSNTVTATRIVEDAEYMGVRCLIRGSLGNARIALQVDIGFGDVVVPRPGKVVYPVLLDFPSPELSGYTMESTIAEKFQAMVKLGTLNSRMKDFYDIWFLSRTFEFKGETLTEAIKQTFHNRNTPIEPNPTVFSLPFLTDKEKQAQWSGFIQKARLAQAPGFFPENVLSIKEFLSPIVVSIVNQTIFHGNWHPPGPWRQ